VEVGARWQVGAAVGNAASPTRRSRPRAVRVIAQWCRFCRPLYVVRVLTHACREGREVSRARASAVQESAQPRREAYASLSRRRVQRREYAAMSPSRLRHGSSYALRVFCTVPAQPARLLPRLNGPAPTASPPFCFITVTRNGSYGTAE